MTGDDIPEAGAGDVDGWFGPDRADITAVDSDGARLLVGTAHILAGLLTAGLLRYARTPGALVEVLCPQVPAGPERDRLLFAAGAAAGLSAGSRRRASRWDAAELQETAAALYEAGFEAMAQLAARAAAVSPPPGPVGGGR